MLTLKNFEKQVNETMLQRGKGYYESGAVTDLEETEEDFWQAEIEGSELYLAEVKLKKGNQISGYFCDCPVDSDICKHIVAVFFAIRKEIKKAGSKPRKSKKAILKIYCKKQT